MLLSCTCLIGVTWPRKRKLQEGLCLAFFLQSRTLSPDLECCQASRLCPPTWRFRLTRHVSLWCNCRLMAVVQNVPTKKRTGRPLSSPFWNGAFANRSYRRRILSGVPLVLHHSLRPGHDHHHVGKITRHQVRSCTTTAKRQFHWGMPP
ncbi:hypothetical protein BDN72DRAFT_373634 [Pluteus cervinus]|uniref:Uncharacterized protein n=1 Tax=Pluteus cervinus TaxID=181527 RepID=A0ACD3B2F0_9AGAR|nr:hypothetical protein BDN72DRAFT_373634 [Pluteus cervinus]